MELLPYVIAYILSLFCFFALIVSLVINMNIKLKVELLPSLTIFYYNQFVILRINLKLNMIINQ